MTDEEKINKLQTENQKLKKEVLALKSNHQSVSNNNDLKQLAKKRIYNIILKVARLDIVKNNKFKKEQLKRLQKAYRAHPFLNPPVSGSPEGIINLDNFSDNTSFENDFVVSDINTIFGLNFDYDKKYTVKELTDKVCYYTLPVLGLEALIRQRRIHQNKQQRRQQEQDDSDDDLLPFL